MTFDDQRTKIGMLVPSANTTLERDARIALTPEVTAHFARIKISKVNPDEVAALIEYVSDAAKLLADAHVQSIAFGCTGGSLIGGLGHDRRIIDLIEDAAGVPATTTSTALIEALKIAGASTVALVTPYPPFLTEAVVDFLNANDIRVAGVYGFDISDPIDIASVNPRRIAEIVREIDSDQADAAFISCTSFRGLEAIRLLGSQLGKPVFSSNQVTYWKAADLLNVSLPMLLDRATFHSN